MRQVVLGAGPLGAEVANQLRVRGDEVSIWSIMGDRAYDMPGTHPAAVDGADVAALIEICDRADVVYLLLNAHYVDWAGLFPSRLSAAMKAAQVTGSTLVYHDNLYMYGDTTEILTEDTPQRPNSDKGRLRTEMAHTFMEAVGNGEIRGVIGRSADMYGPGALNSSFNSTLGERHFYPMLDGRPVSLLGDIDLPHAYGYTKDVAAGLVTLGAHSEALGDIWHLPSAPALTHRELLEIAFEIADVKPRIRSSALSPFFVKMIGRFQDDVSEVAEMLYQFQRPLIVSHDKYAQEFDVTVTPHRDALEKTLDWYRRSTSRIAVTSTT